MWEAQEYDFHKKSHVRITHGFLNLRISDPYGVNSDSTDTVFTDSNQSVLECDVKSDVMAKLKDNQLAELLKMWPNLSVEKRQQIFELAVD